MPKKTGKTNFHQLHKHYNTQHSAHAPSSATSTGSASTSTSTSRSINSSSAPSHKATRNPKFDTENDFWSSLRKKDASSSASALRFAHGRKGLKQRQRALQKAHESVVPSLCELCMELVVQRAPEDGFFADISSSLPYHLRCQAFYLACKRGLLPPEKLQEALLHPETTTLDFSHANYSLVVNEPFLSAFLPKVPVVSEEGLESWEEITNEKLYAAPNQGCSALSRLDLSGCLHMSAGFLEKVVRECKFLTKLRLSRLRVKDLDDLCLVSNSLRKLTISKLLNNLHPNCEFHFQLKTPSLQNVKLQGFNSILLPLALQESLGHTPSLRRVDLSGVYFSNKCYSTDGDYANHTINNNAGPNKLILSLIAVMKRNFKSLRAVGLAKCQLRDADLLQLATAPFNQVRELDLSDNTRLSQEAILVYVDQRKAFLRCLFVGGCQMVCAPRILQLSSSYSSSSSSWKRRDSGSEEEEGGPSEYFGADEDDAEEEEGMQRIRIYGCYASPSSNVPLDGPVLLPLP
ncbi:hypothetical protein QOT17_000258 [Balamuthia mandrillaris]